HLPLAGRRRQVEVLAHPGEAYLLVDHPHRRAHLHLAEKPRDILRVEAHATVAHIAADAVGLVGAVDEKARPSQAERILAERIVRTRWDHCRELGLLLADRRRRIPYRSHVLVQDSRHAARCRAPLHADADGVGLDAMAVRWKIIEPLLGQIDDDAGAGALR